MKRGPHYYCVVSSGIPYVILTLARGLAPPDILHYSAIASVAASLGLPDIDAITSPRAFDEDLHLGPSDLHLVGGGEPALMAQYLLVVDALNFCFWPGERRRGLDGG